MEGKATLCKEKSIFLVSERGKGGLNALHLRSSWERKRFSLG
jgi:hypothetical protein